ncbi:MAG: hypothetical protein K1563_20810, partial [Candidatus Thiodiazotropha sp. (ex. Lucinisca nassula)]|nr:hypothetical protein [Candidatus Thiodiazotropha sp. (ex. Lucinisca nassula)]
ELIADYNLAGKHITTLMLRGDGKQRYWLNQRFFWETVWTKHFFHVREWEERIVDLETGGVLARYVDFGTNIPPIGIGGNSLGDYKFWMQKRSCEKDMQSQGIFAALQKSIEEKGDQE